MCIRDRNSIENRGNMSEDCLYLNVVAPPPRPKPYPVMVYIHAGEFHFGSGADRESDEPHFADDVVLVSFNYRLGVFGFLASDDLRDRTAYGGTGNYGVHDQRAALRSVRWVFCLRISVALHRVASRQIVSHRIALAAPAAS